ncbi:MULTISPECIES: phenylacetaldoxime dehydratase family protein [unclassified Francisella]|uniref:phenylacetaldoxime dehydratase family protein n=1 Tax=unclassified Francisella TaxID=2610885 RepID=UPI002E33566E|nr:MULTISPECIES: phenylacetaldoxime dehydratase family protein [unclassified Francisella]MED7820223.1 phenylacetaldoxime dehydratase family protein [Francisella sp. 19S2-4]MED7831079.1 phenylacetaldoxime dehydratase family protein [Francisella sp. 19S2-10]
MLGSINKPIVANLPIDVKSVTLIQIGLQFIESAKNIEEISSKVLNLIDKYFACSFLKISQFLSFKNRYNIVFLLYYLDESDKYRYINIFELFIKMNYPEMGYWYEIINTPISNIETHSSSQKGVINDSGIFNLAENLDGSVYYGSWGSMRKRMPILNKGNIDNLPRHGRQIQELCIIRSGQNWDAAIDDEIILYKEHLEKKLQISVKGLQNQNNSIGCKYARFLYDIDINNLRKYKKITLLKSSSVYACFLSFESLEQWAKGHSQHLDIWKTYKHQRQEGLLSNLGIWHEVYIVPIDKFSTNHINCILDTNFF